MPAVHLDEQADAGVDGHARSQAGLGVAVVVRAPGDVQVHGLHALRGEVQDERGAGLRAHLLLAGVVVEVRLGILHQAEVLGGEGQARHGVTHLGAHVLQRVEQRAGIVADHGRGRGQAEDQLRMTRQCGHGGHARQAGADPLGGVGHDVGQDQAALGVRVEHTDRAAVVRVQDILHAVRLRAHAVVRDAQGEHCLRLQSVRVPPEVERGAERGGGTHHVRVHPLHVAVHLDGEPAGIHHHALTDHEPDGGVVLGTQGGNRDADHDHTWRFASGGVHRLEEPHLLQVLGRRLPYVSRCLADVPSDLDGQVSVRVHGQHVGRLRAQPALQIEQTTEFQPRAHLLLEGLGEFLRPQEDASRTSVRVLLRGCGLVDVRGQQAERHTAGRCIRQHLRVHIDQELLGLVGQRLGRQGRVQVPRTGPGQVLACAGDQPQVDTRGQERVPLLVVVLLEVDGVLGRGGPRPVERHLERLLRIQDPKGLLLQPRQIERHDTPLLEPQGIRDFERAEPIKKDAPCPGRLSYSRQPLLRSTSSITSSSQPR